MSNLEVRSNGVPAPATSAWGTEAVDASDIRIPKILLMQGLSELVADEKASPGEFVNSITGEKLGSSKSPMPIIPIYMWKDFTIMEELDGKFEFKERLPYTPQNAGWKEFEKREWTDNGVKMRADFGMNFLVMLEKDLKDASSLPFVLSFRRTGINSGKDLATYFTRASLKQVPPCFFTIELSAKMTKNDKGNYYVPTIVKARETQDFQLVEPTLKNWYLTFKSGAAKIDESDIQSETAEAGTGGSTEFAGQF